MRIILFTGKGGVGKTTVAAATAIKIAEQGLKTLVVSTDPAHSLSDALGVQLGPEATEVSKNLWGQEFDVYYSMKKYWGNMRQLMLSLFKFKGLKKVVAEELSVIPGMEEGTAFLWIEKYYREKAFDVLIIDSAPTGETLTLLSLPQVMKSWLTKAFPGQKFAIKTVGSIMRRTAGIPLDKGYEELEVLFNKLERVQEILSDPKISSIRIVANPERMVVQEAKRAYTYLQLYGFNVDGVIVNRILPDTENDFFKNYISSQKKYLEEIDESFSPIPIMHVKHQGQEVFGLDLLKSISESIYQKHNPEAILFDEKPYIIEESKEGVTVKIRLPFLNEKDYQLEKFGDELIITIGNQRKNLFLPKFANFMTLENHHYTDGRLVINLSNNK